MTEKLNRVYGRDQNLDLYECGHTGTGMEGQSKCSTGGKEWQGRELCL